VLAAPWPPGAFRRRPDQRFRRPDQQPLDLVLAPARGRHAVEGGEAGERVPLDQDLARRDDRRRRQAGPAAESTLNRPWEARDSPVISLSSALELVHVIAALVRAGGVIASPGLPDSVTLVGTQIPSSSRLSYYRKLWIEDMRGCGWVRMKSSALDENQPASRGIMSRIRDMGKCNFPIGDCPATVAPSGST
jgi:hypothetical protein